MKIEIDKKILENIKEEIIKYLIRVGFIKNSREEKVFRDRLNAVKHLYVENLKEKTGARMTSRPDSISIDTMFVELSSDKTRVLGFKKEFYELVISQLGHELWHNASNSDSIRGIIINDNFQRFLALNEGITQLLAEDVSGFTLSKYADASYRHFKYIAKILRLSTSNHDILSSYLYHTNDLKNSCNALANDPNFYDQFNEYLSNLFHLKKMIILNCKNRMIDKVSDDYIETFNEIYRNRIIIQYRSLILNIVLPKIKKLKGQEKHDYIESILNVLKEDYEVYRIVSDYLKSVISLSDDEITVLKNELYSMNQTKEEQRKMLEHFAVNSKLLVERGLLKVKQDGTITYNVKGKDIVIKIEQMKTMIYQQLWLIEKKDKIDIEAKLNSIIKNGLEVPDGITILNRRKFFCAIKYYLEKNGYFVLNSYEEIDKVSKFKFHLIKKKIIPSLSDLKNVLKHFKLERSINENGAFEYKIINMKTNNVTYDSTIIQTVLFAYLWIDSFKELPIANLEAVFDKKNEQFYNDVVSIMQNGLLTTGNLEIDKIINKYKNTKYYNVIMKVFKSKESYEMIYNYILTYTYDEDKNNVVLQLKREKSFDEIRYGDFEVKDDAESIINESNSKR